MENLGEYEIGQWVTFPISTRNNAGLADADALPVISAYEDDANPANPPFFTTPSAKLNDAGTIGLYRGRFQLLPGAGFEERKRYLLTVDASVDGGDIIDRQEYILYVRQTSAATLSLDFADITITRLVLNKTQFYEVGRELLNIEIQAEGINLPEALTAVPMRIGFTSANATQPPDEGTTTQAQVLTLNGRIYARIFVGTAEGDEEIAVAELAGSAPGTEYKVWLLLDGAERIWQALEIIRVF